MNQIDPLRTKYDKMYMAMAKNAGAQSTSKKRLVGCVVVLSSGLLAPGLNGMPAKMPNDCETLVDGKLVSKPEVIHAERNALDKLSRAGISPVGSVLYTTTAPCLSCALSLAAVGVSRVVYLNEYKNSDGLEYLTKQCIPWSKLCP